MKVVISIVAAVLLAAGCSKESETRMTTTTPETAAPAASAFDPAKHREELTAWQKRRAERLTAEDGWTTLIGLHWLQEGRNDVKLATGETVTVTLENGQVTLDAREPMSVDGQPIRGATALRDDTSEAGPSIVQMGSVRFNVIKRGAKYALRVKDAQAETRTHFAGLEYYPIDPKWRVEARLEPYTPAKKIPITDVTGMTSDSDSPGALVFTLDGKEYRVDPILEQGSDDLFIIFRDETSRDSTYPAGRYVYAKKPGPDGKVTIDFNRAYNPPCAFTPFATCPLPPLQNRIATRIEAGEKKYAGGHT